MLCPICQSDMWDNRATKRNPKQPDYKCKNKGCGKAVWLTPAEEKSPVRAEQYQEVPTTTKTVVNPNIEILKLAVTLACKGEDTGMLSDKVWNYYKELQSMANGTYMDFPGGDL